MVKKNGSSKRASKSSTAPSPEAAPHKGGGRFVRYCFTLILLGVMVLAWLSMVSFHPDDPPSSNVYVPSYQMQNRAGIVGAHVAYTLRYWVGCGTYVGLGLITLWAAMGLIGRGIRDVPWRLIGMAMLVTAVSAAANLHSPNLTGEMVRNPAGVLGIASGEFLLAKFGPHGSWVVMLIVGCIGVMLTADHLVKMLFTRLVGAMGHRSGMAGKYADLRERRKAALAAAAAAPVAIATAPSAPRQKPPTAAIPERAKPAADSAAPSGEEKQTDRPRSLKKLFARPDRPKSPTQPQPAKRAGKKAKKLPAAAPAKVKRIAKPPLPSMDLLVEPKGGYQEVAEMQAAQRKFVLQQTLDDFNVPAKVDGYQTGPVITLYEVSLQPGVKTALIANLATDIARSLAVTGVRVVPPRFGKDTVGIEVPNLNKEIVRIRELMDKRQDAEKDMTLPMYLGKDAAGQAIVIDLAKCPHMLIAGTTGSGKSVCINSIIMSLLMTRTTQQVRFILVDPKMVEMAAFEKLPHLLCPTINDMKKAEEILEWATTKMDERYELLREAGVKNLAGYNKLSPKQLYERFGVETEEEQARIPTSMPSYVIIIDELADLMMTSSKEVEAYIIRIAQKARAVGIHLVLATQRPSANVVTGLIKSNMPCRISFRVASGQESRIVLDQKGAEVLLGQGDMLALQPGRSDLDRAQGTFVDDSEIYAVVKELEQHQEQHFDVELLKLQSSTGGELSGERDELFDSAVEIVLASGRGSVSLLQRRMQVGYGRASRIIDQMAEAGLLGAHKGSQARECLITVDDWHEMQASIEADQSGASSLNGQPTSA
ncbi:MAG: DNA translocase FtsK 4TM domain-containing protein [Phycisphaerae bacterium]|nr:DNA translocase FtsK 4TM domain-containing protein [Phycisphaerae bacterium]